MTLLPGCPIAACGGWEGRGDTMLRNDRGDAVMLCENGGYAASIGTTTSEGTFDWTDVVRASSPETGAQTFAFTSSISADGSTYTYASAELAGSWTAATLDKVELDHAHVQCADLQTRAWWPTVNATVYLPQSVAFKTPAAGYPTADACHAAQDAGEYPAEALCEDELLICANGRVTYNQGQTTGTGSYGAMYGDLDVNPTPGAFFASFTGTFSAAGTLKTPTATWKQVPVSTMSNGATCQ
jgi:hypothetical protein